MMLPGEMALTGDVVPNVRSGHEVQGSTGVGPG
jgi:hypothetical protein